MTNQSGDATNRGDAMSDIERFDIRCLAVNRRENGDWVRYDDHRSEVERLKAQVAALTLAVEQADPSATLDAATDVSDVALAEYRKRWPR